MVIVEISAVNKLRAAIRNYFIRKDAIGEFQLGEFSVFDARKTNLLYRIESYHAIEGKAELIDVSSKKVIGKITYTVGVFSYTKTFSIFDFSSEQWIDGEMEERFHVFKEKFLIKWNKRNIIIETKFGASTTTFKYEDHSGILAQFKYPSNPFVWTNRYHLQILSDDFPHAFYFIAIAIKDHSIEE